MKKIYLLLLFFLIPLNVSADELNLAENAKSAIMIEATTGEILYKKNEKERLAPASMTKIMSLILIMENIESGKLKWNDIVVTSNYASSMGGSQVFLKPNEIMSVEDLIKAICVASANDATVAMAEKIAGTEKAFVKLMNDKAKELGAVNTNFVNSTGLPAKDHYSTAYDMSIMAKELIRHEKILSFTKIYEDYLRKNTSNSFWLVNTNKLVRFYDYIDGLKTGFTDDAGYCLTATGKKGNMRLITVVMKEDNTDNRTKDTIAMMDYGFNMYSVKNIISKDNKIGNIYINLGKEEYADISSLEDINIVNSNQGNEAKFTYEIETDNVTAPLSKGSVVGKITVYKDGKYFNSSNLIITKNIKKANIVKVFFRNIKDVLVGSM
jgi:D-alanyl-D-alanine carboxypeptidase (penicillin-binding protein 5/6)